MLARYSGQAGLCVIGSGPILKIAQIGQSYPTFSPIDSRLVGRLFESCTDATQETFGSEGEAIRAASRAWASNLAIRLFLMVLDPEQEDRDEIAADLDSLIKDFEVSDECIENQTFSQRLPAFAVDAARGLQTGTSRVASLLERLINFQSIIAEVRESFDRAVTLFIEVEADRVEFRELAIDKGCFRALVISIAEKRSGNIAVLHVFQSMQSLPNGRSTVSAWTDPFRTASARPLIPNVDLVADVREVAYEGDSGATRRQVYENVTSQQISIIEKLKSGNLQLAVQFCDELVKQQIAAGDEEYAAKTLCKLSQEAKRLQIFELQLEWAEEATHIAPLDHWTHGQYADALIQVGRFAQATEELERTETAGDPSFAANGRARILRAQGRLVEARRIYVECKAKAPNKTDLLHAWAGAAGVLREMGYLDQSRAEYEEGLHANPSEPILVTGLAATLTEMGLLEAAATAYRRASRSADAVVALNGYANVKKLAGSLDEAEEEYRNISKLYTYDPISRCGLADVMRLKGKHSEALEIYKDVQKRFPYRPVPFTGAAFIYKDLGRWEEALDELTKSAELFPNDVFTMITLASLHKKQGQFTAAFGVIEKASAVDPQNFDVMLARADLLRIIGKDDDALCEYNRILEINPRNRQAVNAKASLLIKIGLYYEADQLLGIGNRQTQADWRLFALRGLIDMRLKRSRHAQQQLEWAIPRVPYAQEQQLLKKMLAFIHLENSKPVEAVSLLASTSGAALSLIELHAYAANDNLLDAALIYKTTIELPPQFIELRDEIARRYKIIEGKPSRTNEWLSLREQEVLLWDAAA